LNPDRAPQLKASRSEAEFFSPIMSISIYYTARRKQPLSTAERLMIDSAVSKAGVEPQIEEYCATGHGLNWESFCVYDKRDSTEWDVIFEGATKLPDNSEDAAWVGLQHWCQLLTEIRRNLSEASWEVQVEDHPIVWDEDQRAYDPSK